jgi:hypothetical protein
MTMMGEYKVWISFLQQSGRYYSHVIPLGGFGDDNATDQSLPCESYDLAMEDLLRKLRSVLESERPI